MNKREVMKVENLVRNYKMVYSDRQDEEEIKVLKGLDFTIEEQEFVGIMGKSGCGKTTLLKVLGLIDKPTSGKIFFTGKDASELWSDELADIRRREIGFVFQDFYLLNSLSVKENIMLPMVLDKAPVDKCYKNVEAYAENFGLSHLLEKQPYEVSGGEKQRVAICRALINNPDLILADEPTGNLDSKSGKIVIDALKDINEHMGKTIIMVTHDPQMASYCSRLILLKDGLILEDLKNSGDQELFYQEILGKMSMKKKERMRLLQHELYVFYRIPMEVAVVVMVLYTLATFHARMYNLSVQKAYVKNCIGLWLGYVVLEWIFIWILGKFLIKKVETNEEFM